MNMNMLQQDELERFHDIITESLQRFSSQELGQNQEHIVTLLEALPAVSEKELEKLGHTDSACSICMQPLLAILAEEETASAMESPAIYSGELGVTRLSQPWQCGHIFCRRDIVKWIKTGKQTCPMCRKSLAEPGDQSAPPAQEPESESWPDDLFSNTSFHRLFSNSARTNAGNDDDRRNEFSGMYS
ncbi:hypothetical protein AGABI2DRAFT_191833 [Agaricus bisporus var. bisporus H97]|uniref:hypothetical protein n=1 Tax=Agaricus bisporus var. bisporus (strain H97 / ATCC MYA-4626 / FGSC 10389) TaxID=936046 RepID=UPI00029F53EA|nr:hypothetical protein AGABI2DRAFT_191833 [Agaricus bisporus var. bisporus H97]EKV48203.1 hypothetical protein AGABI2DRAFT_191833 [Agaricus bisporus var. bisporus H97]